MIHASHARRSDSEPDIAARFSAAGDLSRGWQGQEAHAGQHHALACGQDRSIAAAAARGGVGRRSGSRIEAVAQPAARACGGGAWRVALTYQEITALDRAVLANRERDKWNFQPPDGESYAQL